MNTKRVKTTMTGKTMKKKLTSTRTRKETITTTPPRRTPPEYLRDRFSFREELETLGYQMGNQHPGLAPAICVWMARQQLWATAGEDMTAFRIPQPTSDPTAFCFVVEGGVVVSLSLKAERSRVEAIRNEIDDVLVADFSLHEEWQAKRKLSGVQGKPIAWSKTYVPYSRYTYILQYCTSDRHTRR